MSFSKNELNKIKSRISLINEFEKKTRVIKKGKDYWCCCVFHEEKTPSCKINEELGSFYCFGCGARGDIFTLFTDLYNYNFIDAVKELSDKAGIKIVFKTIKQSNKEKRLEEIIKLSSDWFQQNLLNSAANKCNEYLKSRKITKETIAKFKIGFSYNPEYTLYDFLKKKSFTDDELLESNVVKLNKNKKIRDYFYKRLIFPICNLQGSVVGFGGRALDQSNPKYINSPESSFFQKRYLLYNLHLAKKTARQKNNLLICEGYMDVISLYQNGIFSVVAPLGTALTVDQLELCWKFSSKPTLMFDGDGAGLRASYKSSLMALKFISPTKFLQVLTLPEGYDPDNFINEVSLKNFVDFLKQPISLAQFIFDLSSATISFDNADAKISYDKYLDDLVTTIKDKKTQYFYKNEFKNLFFKKIKRIGSTSVKKNYNYKEVKTNLLRKQLLSFISTAINHLEIRKDLLKVVIEFDLFEENEKKLIFELQKDEFIDLSKDEIISKFTTEPYKSLIQEILNNGIYQLFPYANSQFDPQKSFQEVKKSLDNLNTRLLNLKKINKSLDNFVKNSNSPNWRELQSISNEIVEKND